MFDANQNQNNGQNKRDRMNLTLLVLILGILSVASIGILTLSMLRQLYPKVFAAPGIAKQLNYQGKLQDAGGITVPDGSYAMKFTIYDSAAGGNVLWTSKETDACGASFNPAAKSISTYNGVFSTLLGESGDCAINLDFADDAYYLGVTIGADAEMTPRKRIGAAGYAFNADLLDGLNTSNAGGSGDYVPVTDASGNLFLTKDFTVTSNEVGSQAVYGAATDTSATVNYGGYFTAAGTGFTPPLTMAAGVYGAATSTAAIMNVGGYFTAAGTGSNASGVVGLASATGAVQNAGGTFVATGDTGRGVVALANSSVGPNYGVRSEAKGTGAGTAGVYGFATGAGNDVRGVHGVANASGAFTTYGGYFKTEGHSGSGVYGEAVSPPGTGLVDYGGYFKAGSDIGVGVYGEGQPSTNSTNYGGYFLANGGAGRGVYGEASAAGPNANYGGYFSAAGTGGAMGVYGDAVGATGTNYGVYGTVTSGTGWAGYFSGGYGVYTDNDLYVGNTSEGITNAGFTMTGLGSGYFDDKLGVNGNVYTNNSFIAGASTTYSDGTITTSASDLVVTPAGGEMTVVGNIESLASTSFNPVLKSTTGTGLGVINLYVSGRYAYVLNVAAATLQIFDVTDPASPTSVSSTATNANPRYVYVSGRYAYIVHDSVTSTLEIFDVSNPTSPTSLSSTATGADPKAIYVSGHYAYIVENAGTLEIFDVSNPAAPTSIGSTATGTGPFSLYVSGRYAYVVNQAPTSTLEIFDISNPAAPSAVGSVATGSDPRGVYVSGRYAYVGAIGVGALEVYDISNSALPFLTGTVAAGNPYGVYVSGRYAYVADIFGNTIRTVDVSVPALPVVVGSAASGANPTSVYVSGRYAYLANAGANNFQIFDVSGLEVTSGMVHSLEAGNLQVRNDIIAQGELSVDGGLNVGGSGFFADSLSVHSAGTLGGYFQADGSGATGLLGYTTNTFSSALYGLATGDDSAGITAGALSTTGVNKGGSFSAGTGSTVIGGTGHTMGVQGLADGGAGTNYGGVFTAGNFVSTTIAGSNNIGVAGFAEDSAGTNYGGYFQAQNAGYGVYSTVTDASAWAGYFTGGYGLYTSELHVNDSVAGVGYNRIGTNATDHGLSTANDLLITGALEVDGSSWFDGGHTDIAEMIAYNGQGEAGDVIVIDENYDNTAKLADKPYDKNVIGIISTNPSLVITGNIREGKLLAVAGRVPTKVSNLNGPVARGDLLTTSPKPGYAMKATEAGPVLGKALEPCGNDSCTIWVFLNVGWYGGVSVNTATSTEINYSVVTNVIADKLTADLDAKGFTINNISKIIGENEAWSIDETGLLKVRVEFSRDDETIKKDIYALSSTGIEVVLSGSGKLDKGEILVDFSQIDKDFPEIIDETVPLKISVTPTEACQGMYVAEKYPQGFKVKELNGGTSGATFDWIVIGRRKGYETVAERQ